MVIKFLLYLTFSGLKLFHSLFLIHDLQLVVVNQSSSLSNCSSSTRYYAFCTLGDNLGLLEVVCQILIAGFGIIKTMGFFSYLLLNLFTLPFLVGVKILWYPLSISNWLTFFRFLRSLEYVPGCSTSTWCALARSEPSACRIFSTWFSRSMRANSKELRPESINSAQYFIVIKNCQTIWRDNSFRMSWCYHWRSTSWPSLYNRNRDALNSQKWNTCPFQKSRSKLS